MILKILGSSSSGNCYIFETDTTALIVECGVSFKKIKETLNFDLKKVVGCIITHEHLDHSKSVGDMCAAGIDVYGSQGTLDATGVKSHRLVSMKAMQPVNIGEFKIMPFDVKHDCAEPFGYLICHAECGNTLFITDSYYVQYTFKNLHNVIVEANYCEDILGMRVDNGTIHGFLKDRVISSHMSLRTCKKLLSANDLSKVNNIVLIHLSDKNSDAVKFKKEVTDLTGKNVHIADKNMNISFNKTAF
jgi:phosphoribosyl 1,2-cyclic phosphodiesterase